MQNSHVWRWLDGVAVTNINDPATTLPLLESRAPAIAPAPVTDRYSRKRRRPLTPSDTNSDHIRGNQSMDGQDGSKRIRRTGHDKDSAVDMAVDDGVVDLNATPKAPLLGPMSLTRPSGDMSDVASNFSAFNDLSTDGGGSRASQTSRKRKRSVSPTKQLASLAFQDYPVKDEEIDRIADMPEPLRPLVKDLRQIAKGFHLLPEAEAETLRAHLVDDDDRSEWEGIISSTRQTYGSIPALEWAKEIVHDTKENTRLGRSEPAWNCNVHSRILRKACKGSAHGEKFRPENICTAAIVAPGSGASTSRKVDFAIAMVIDHDKQKALRDRGIESISHTDYLPLTFAPPAITIETKLLGESGLDADAQVTTWAYAQIEHLSRFASIPRADIPALPLLIVQGGQWTFKYFNPQADQAVKWSEVVLGKTSTLKGFYQVYTALQRLILWAEKVYRPWFEGSVIAPKIASQPAG